MWKFDRLCQFLQSVRKLDFSRQILALTCLTCISLYPGENKLQSLVIHRGSVRSYNTEGIAAPALYPQGDGTVAPATSARAIVVQDAAGKTLLYAKNPDAPALPASTTKIMTALVALDTWKDLQTVIEVKNEDRAIGQTIELERGEKITVENILYGLLVHSGNDAALALADNYCAPTVAKGEGGSCGYTAFVSAMNAKAKSLHLDHTTFKNPSGVEQYGHVTTARDLAILAGVALQNPVISRIAQIKSITVTDVTGTITHKLDTTNQLLGQIEGLKGLKTGWTENAGECLVSYVERGDRKIIVVVLGSQDRFGDSSTLIDWAYAHHEWITPQI